MCALCFLGSVGRWGGGAGSGGRGGGLCYGHVACVIDPVVARERLAGARHDVAVRDRPSRWREFCHSADALSPSRLKHLLKVEGGAAEWQSRRRLDRPVHRRRWRRGGGRHLGRPWGVVMWSVWRGGAAGLIGGALRILAKGFGQKAALACPDLSVHVHRWPRGVLRLVADRVGLHRAGRAARGSAVPSGRSAEPDQRVDGHVLCDRNGRCAAPCRDTCHLVPPAAERRVCDDQAELLKRGHNRDRVTMRWLRPHGTLELAAAVAESETPRW